MVVPGLHDMHVHPTGAGLWQQRCMFPQGSSAQVVVDTVKGCVAKRGKGAWITGGSWDAAPFGKSPPHRALLDKVAPDNPVYLNDISGHSALVNSKALQLAGITKATPNPPGGIIERDAKGEPTGVLRESGSAAVSRLVPPATAEENATALKWSLDQMLAQGVTSFTDAGTSEDIERAYATLADRGVLKQRVRGCFMWRRRFSPRRKPMIRSCAGICMRAIASSQIASSSFWMASPPTGTPPRWSIRTRMVSRGRRHVRAGYSMIPPEPPKASVVDFDRRGLNVEIPRRRRRSGARRPSDAIEVARKANG